MLTRPLFYDDISTKNAYKDKLGLTANRSQDDRRYWNHFQCGSILTFLSYVFPILLKFYMTPVEPA